MVSIFLSLPIDLKSMQMEENNFGVLTIPSSRLQDFSQIPVLLNYHAAVMCQRCNSKT